MRCRRSFNDNEPKYKRYYCRSFFPHPHGRLISDTDDCETLEQDFQNCEELIVNYLHLLGSRVSARLLDLGTILLGIRSYKRCKLLANYGIEGPPAFSISNGSGSMRSVQ